MVFQRGEFDARSTEMVSWALLWYTAGLVGHSFVEILSRAFYALHDTKTPVIVGTIAMGLNVVFSITFARLFEQIGWIPVGGLALANSLATALEATALFIFMRRRLNGIEGRSILDGAWRVSVAASAVRSTSICPMAGVKLATVIADCQVLSQDWRGLQAALQNQDWGEWEFARHAYSARGLRGQEMSGAAKAEWELALKGANDARRGFGQEDVAVL